MTGVRADWTAAGPRLRCCSGTGDSWRGSGPTGATVPNGPRQQPRFGDPRRSGRASAHPGPGRPSGRPQAVTLSVDKRRQGRRISEPPSPAGEVEHRELRSIRDDTAGQNGTHDSRVTIDVTVTAVVGTRGRSGGLVRRRAFPADTESKRWSGPQRYGVRARSFSGRLLLRQAGSCPFAGRRNPLPARKLRMLGHEMMRS
jgi:hypothetical protein